MRRPFRPALVAAFLCLVRVAPAAAQAPPRFSIVLNGGAQTKGESLTDRFEFQRELESATADVRYPGKASPVVDVGGGVRLWRQFGVGLAVTHGSHDAAAGVDARIPHPFFFNHLRQTSGEAPGATRSETAAHVQLLYAVALSSRVRVALSVGPTIFKATQELVTEVGYDESYPFDTATFRSGTLRSASGSAAGFNAGVDVAWMFSPRLGIGVFVRGTRGTVRLDAGSGRRVSADAGGVQAGAGVRLGF